MTKDEAERVLAEMTSQWVKALDHPEMPVAVTPKMIAARLDAMAQEYAREHGLLSPTPAVVRLRGGPLDPQNERVLEIDPPQFVLPVVVDQLGGER